MGDVTPAISALDARAVDVDSIPAVDNAEPAISAVDVGAVDIDAMDVGAVDVDAVHVDAVHVDAVDIDTPPPRPGPAAVTL